MVLDQGLIGTWSPGIGDPTVVGWATTVAYLVTAFTCRRVALATTTALRESRRERKLWWALTVLFLLLGINKQLDLQSAFTEIGRIVARRQGWYEQRQTFQREFIAFIALLGAGAVVAAFVAARSATPHLRVALAGAMLVVVFVLVRAASFHHVDVFIDRTWLGIRANWIFELGGIAIVFFAARARKLPTPAPKATRRKVP
jgi:hypothetical protein